MAWRNNRAWLDDVYTPHLLTMLGLNGPPVVIPDNIPADVRVLMEFADIPPTELQQWIQEYQTPLRLPPEPVFTVDDITPYLGLPAPVLLQILEPGATVDDLIEDTLQRRTPAAIREVLQQCAQRIVPLWRLLLSAQEDPTITPRKFTDFMLGWLKLSMVFNHVYDLFKARNITLMQVIPGSDLSLALGRG